MVPIVLTALSLDALIRDLDVAVNQYSTSCLPTDL